MTSKFDEEKKNEFRNFIVESIFFPSSLTAKDNVNHINVFELYVGKIVWSPPHLDMSKIIWFKDSLS